MKMPSLKEPERRVLVSSGATHQSDLRRRDFGYHLKAYFAQGRTREELQPLSRPCPRSRLIVTITPDHIGVVPPEVSSLLAALDICIGIGTLDLCR